MKLLGAKFHIRSVLFTVLTVAMVAGSGWMVWHATISADDYNTNTGFPADLFTSPASTVDTTPATDTGATTTDTGSGSFTDVLGQELGQNAVDQQQSFVSNSLNAAANDAYNNMNSLQQTAADAYYAPGLGDAAVTGSTKGSDGSITITYANGANATISANGQVVTSTDTSNNKTVAQVDSTGNLVNSITTNNQGQKTQTVTNDGGGTQTRTTYDPTTGKPTSTVKEPVPAKSGKSNPTQAPAAKPVNFSTIGTFFGISTCGSTDAGNGTAAQNAAAGGINDISNGTSGSNSVSALCLSQYIKTLYEWALVIGAGLAVIMIMYAGYTYITAFGDPEGIRTAKDYLTGTLIGLAVLILTATIANTLALNSPSATPAASGTSTTSASPTSSSPAPLPSGIHTVAPQPTLTGDAPTGQPTIFAPNP